MVKIKPTPKPFGWWHELSLALLLIALLAAAGLVMPRFLTMRGQLFLVRHLWEFAILALAMTPIIISAGIDLSVGSSMGMCAVAFGICFSATNSVWAAAAAAIVIGTMGGMINGLLVAQARLHPLIVTLATYAAFRGIAEGVSQGRPYSKFGEAFSQFSRAQWMGVSAPSVVFVVLAVGVAAFLALTPTGRFVYAIGHNEKAARFSGIAVDRIKFALYTFSGMLAGLATVIYVSRFDTAKADAGRGFELDVITAVVVGGTSIFGGRGNIGGTVLGLLLIHETRLFVGRYWRVDEFKSITIGALLILSVVLFRILSPRSRDG